MNVIEIKVGRDADTGKLRLTVGGKAVLAGEANACPDSVSREHALISVSDEGIVTIHNLNVENDIYVDGIGVEQKRIAEPVRIELGREHYPLSWESLRPLIPRFADIRPLQQVWQDFEAKQLKQEISERRFAVLRYSTGIVTLASIALGRYFGEGMLSTSLYWLAGIMAAVFAFFAYKSASDVPQRRRQLQKDTEQKYRCPNCGSLFPLQKYDLLRQQKRCSHCQAIFIK